MRLPILWRGCEAQRRAGLGRKLRRNLAQRHRRCERAAGSGLPHSRQGFPGAIRLGQSLRFPTGKRMCGDAAKSIKCRASACIPTTMDTSLLIPCSRNSCNWRRSSGLIVQLVVSMEDVRTQGPLMRVPPVDLSALPRGDQARTAARLVLLNWRPAIESQNSYSRWRTPEQSILTSPWWKGLKESRGLWSSCPPSRVLFGSNYPLFYFESAVLKMQESGLSESREQALFEGNARRLLARTAS